MQAFLALRGTVASRGWKEGDFCWGHDGKAFLAYSASQKSAPSSRVGGVQVWVRAILCEGQWVKPPGAWGSAATWPRPWASLFLKGLGCSPTLSVLA